MLDGITCVSDGASNCYANATAKAVGVGLVAGGIYNWNGTVWASGSNYLIDDKSSLITAVTTTNSAWARLGAPTVTAKNAVTGLYYDTQGATYNWSGANTFCTNKGMRLPSYSETNAGYGLGITGGVPAYPVAGNSSWTAMLYSAGRHYHWYPDANIRADGDTWVLYVRCVSN